MSSKRWPAGALRDALLEAHQKYPTATAPDLARFVECDPGCARVILRSAGVSVRKAKPQKLTWTAAKKQRLLQGAIAGETVTQLSEGLGVAPQSIVLGALAVIRELACAHSS